MMAAALDTAALTSEVSNLKDGHTALRGEFRDLKINVDAGFSLIGQKIDAKTLTNWTPIAIAVGAFTAVMGTCLSALVAIGISFYGGLREQSTKHEAVIESLRDRQVPRVEHERVWREQADDQRLVNDRLRLQNDTLSKTRLDLEYLKGQLTPLPPRQ